MTMTSVGTLTLTYTAPDGTVTVRRLPMDRWDEIHDRLESQGMCAHKDIRMDMVIAKQRKGMR